MRRRCEAPTNGSVQETSTGLPTCVADDFVEHDEMPGLPPTKDGMLDYFRMLLAAFPDMRLEVEDLIAGGDKTRCSGDSHGNAPR